MVCSILTEGDYAVKDSSRRERGYLCRLKAIVFDRNFMPLFLGIAVG